MKKKEAIALTKKYFHWWQDALGLRWWCITLRFQNSIENSQPGHTTFAICDVLWQYLEATITINIKAIKNLTEEKIEKLIIHEMMHILINEMRESEINHEERVATTLSDAFGWTVDKVKRESQISNTETKNDDKI